MTCSECKTININFVFTGQKDSSSSNTHIIYRIYCMNCGHMAFLTYTKKENTRIISKLFENLPGKIIETNRFYFYNTGEEIYPISVLDDMIEKDLSISDIEKFLGEKHFNNSLKQRNEVGWSDS